MGRRHVVKELDEAQFDFVINAIIDGATDREISAAFESKYKQKLSKSSLNRWRAAAGNELAERYRLARYQARQLLSNLKEEDKDQDSYQIVMRNIEERLLTATRDVISQDPVKLLQIRQEEQKRRLREREVDIKAEHLALEREKLRGVQVDRVALGTEFMTDLLEYLETDAEGLRFFSRHAKTFNAFLNKKYGESQTA